MHDDRPFFSLMTLGHYLFIYLQMRQLGRELVSLVLRGATKVRWKW